MSITTDLKNYVDQTVATAQAQLNDVAGTANDYVGKYRDDITDVANKANGAVNDLRVSAEKAINLDALRTAVEPYLAQVREYGTAVTDRAEDLLNGVKDDPRLARFVETANSVSAVVIEQVTEYVVKPVQSFTGFGAAPATPTAAKPSKPAATKPAATKPATTTPATTTPSAGRGATTRPAAKSTARKTTAKSTSAARTTAPKSAPAAKPARKSTARPTSS